MDWFIEMWKRTIMKRHIVTPQTHFKEGSVSRACPSRLFKLAIQCFVTCLLLMSLPTRAALEGYWNFNGNANDLSGNGITGTEVGAPVYEANFPAAIGSGQSLRFDGTNDYVTLGNPTSLDFGTENFSVGGWIKTTQAYVSGDVGKGTLYAKGGDGTGGIRYALIHNEVGAGNNGRLDFILDDDVTKSAISSAATPLLNDGNWHHILGVRDGANQFLYVDGVLASSAALPPSYDLSGTSQADALIGAINSASTNLIYKAPEPPANGGGSGSGQWRACSYGGQRTSVPGHDHQHHCHQPDQTALKRRGCLRQPGNHRYSHRPASELHRSTERFVLHWPDHSDGCLGTVFNE